MAAAVGNCVRGQGASGRRQQKNPPSSGGALSGGFAVYIRNNGQAGSGNPTARCLRIRTRQPAPQRVTSGHARAVSAGQKSGAHGMPCCLRDACKRFMRRKRAEHCRVPLPKIRRFSLRGRFFRQPDSFTDTRISYCFCQERDRTEFFRLDYQTKCVYRCMRIFLLADQP